MSEKPTYEELEKIIQELKETLHERNMFLDNIPDHMIIQDLEQRVIWANNGAVDSVGKKLEDIVGLHCYEIWQQSNESCEGCPILETMKTGKVKERETMTPNGHAYHIYGRPMYDRKGRIVGAFECSRDITERKQVEVALQQAHNKLEQRVKERAQELEIQKRTLEDVNTALNVMLKKRDEDKLMMEERVLFNVKELIDPLIGNLKNSGLDEHQTGYVDTLETFLAEIVSPFSQTLHTKYLKLTLSEIWVANLVKGGKTTKEIAHLLNSTSEAIAFHRQNLRKKLGLSNRKENLGSHLLSLLE